MTDVSLSPPVEQVGTPELVLKRIHDLNLTSINMINQQQDVAVGTVLEGSTD